MKPKHIIFIGETPYVRKESVYETLVDPLTV